MYSYYYSVWVNYYDSSVMLQRPVRRFRRW